MDYNHISHTHCWNNTDNPCGIPVQKHTQCCLCDMKYDLIENGIQEFEEKFDCDIIEDGRNPAYITYIGKGGLYSFDSIKEDITSFLRTFAQNILEAERVRIEKEIDDMEIPDVSDIDKWPRCSAINSALSAVKTIIRPKE